ncbi:hypothetical protein RvY_16484-1 [Ramazzottius varieornatus]|uniref:Uncharacterized protein n=2 Tax=Ramazzottius varieornatus TaxID=947166 RepID=A0A1D1W665_RAMVA|nr:hypothetical protein RvY_16484-1 [Ramazzottius varieornatus]
MSDNEENDGGGDTERDKAGDSKPGRLDVWAEFERSSEYWLNSKLRQATCKHCVEAGVKNAKPIRGDKSRMEQHLKKCAHVPRTVREKHFPVTVKRASATETSTELATKRVRSQSSLLGFVARPLTKDEQKQFEELYGDACVSCNILFSAADDARMERLLKFVRPSVVIPSRFTVSRRIVPARIAEATSEVTSKLTGQKFLTLTFDGYKNVNRDKILGFLLTVPDESGTVNFTLGSALDITGVNYDGEYVMKESLQKITQVKKEYKADVRYVTCDSDGAHRKARRLLSEKLPHILFSPCNAHQINLIVQDVIKFVPQFKGTLRQSDVVSNWFRKSGLSQGKLRDLQFEFYSKEISMPGWTQTRWYSIYVSVQRVLDSKSALQMYGVRYGTNLGLVPFELKVILDETISGLAREKLLSC